MRLSLLYEADGRIVNFKYDTFKQDPRPRVFLMGRWQHPNTGNTLVAGINLNYLSDEQIKQLQDNAKEVLKPSNLKSKYWKGRELLPEIFEKYYRTYNQDHVNSVTRDALKFFKPSDLDKPKEEPKADVKAGVPEVEVPKDKEGTPSEPQKIEPGIRKSEVEGDQEATAKVKPELEKETTKQREGVQPSGGEGEKPPKPAEPARPQKSMSPEEVKADRAQKLKDAAERSKAADVKPPEPPDDIKGVMGMFK